MSVYNGTPGFTIRLEISSGGGVHSVNGKKGVVDLNAGDVGAYPEKIDPEYAGQLLFVGEDGAITPLMLGDGLEVVDGKLTVTSAAAAKAICGEALCGEVICGNV